MTKSEEYRNMLGNILAYYYQELINEGCKDPVREIVTEFIEMLDVSTKQEQYLLNEIDSFELNLNDYIEMMATITEMNLEEPQKTSREDLDSILTAFKLLKKQIVVSRKKGA